MTHYQLNAKKTFQKPVIFFRAIQKNFVDMENMFDLLKENQEVIDAPGAGQLAVIRGGIDFSNVCFSYIPERVILKNLNFNIAPGMDSMMWTREPS
jgi:ATP-binding cassette subfamily B (MDR/TAP) protein 6